MFSKVGRAQRKLTLCLISKLLLDSDSTGECFVKYCRGRWHRLSAVGGVWQLRAFSLIKLSNNHWNGFHTFCCIGDTPTSMASLPEKREKEFWALLTRQVFCFFSSFTEVEELGAGSQISVYSVTHCFGEKSCFHRWQQKSHSLSKGRFGLT